MTTRIEVPGITFKRIYSYVPIYNILFKKLFTSDQSEVTSNDIKRILKNTQDSLITRTTRISEVIEHLLEANVLYRTRFKPVAYKPRGYVFYILPKEGDTTFKQAIEITVGKGVRFIDLSEEKKNIHFKQIPIPKEATEILTDVYMTCSAIITREETILEINNSEEIKNKKPCRIKKIAKLYQLKSQQEVPLPPLYANSGDKYMGEININGVPPEKFGINCEYEIETIENIGNLKLYRGIVKLHNIPVSSYYSISIECCGVLPVCKAKAGMLVTCIPIMLTYNSIVEIRLNELELETDCYIVAIRCTDGYKSPFAVRIDENMNFSDIKFEFKNVKKKDGSKTYRLEITHRDITKKVSSDFFKSVRSTGGGLLQIRMIDPEKLARSYRIVAGNGICGLKRICKI